MNAFTTSQFDLATKLNVTPDEIRKRRKKLLAENTDWKQVGNEIFYTDAAVDAIRASLGLPAHKEPEATTPPLEPQKTPDAPPATQPEPDKTPVAETPLVLTVYRIVTNPRIIEAHFADKNPADRANILRIRVRDNSNFTRGMEVPVRLITGDLYELTGRLPRWRGKF